MKKKDLLKGTIALEVNDGNRQIIADILKMFGQKFTGAYRYPYVAYDENYNNWCGYQKLIQVDVDRTVLTLVKPKHLKAILAKEYLKNGDFIVASIGDTKYYVEFDFFKEDDDIFIGKRYITIHKVDNSVGEVLNFAGGFTKFERFATEDEIILFKESKKELVEGEWYKGNNWLLMYSKDEQSASGFYSGSYGYKQWSFYKGGSYGKEAVEATPKEVEEALVKEAKKQGFKYDSYIFDERTNILWGNDNDDDAKEEKILFNKGIWVEVVKPKKAVGIKSECVVVGEVSEETETTISINNLVFLKDQVRFLSEEDYKQFRKRYK